MKKENPEENVKTDLKHDNMEFTPPQEGGDVLDTDDEHYEEDSISAEELNAIEDDEDNEAAALNATEVDIEADEDQLPDEDWTDDLPDTEQQQDQNHRRS